MLQLALTAVAAGLLAERLKAMWSIPPPPPLAPPPLLDGAIGVAVAFAFVVMLAVVAIRFSRRVALQRSLAQRALRKRAERDAQRERAAAAGLDWPGLLRWAAPLNPPTPPEAVVQLSATELLAAMEARQLSAEYVMRCFVARAMAAGRALQCNAEERFEAAVAEAAACDAERARGSRRGVLHGLPLSVKDQIDMAGPNPNPNPNLTLTLTLTLTVTLTLTLTRTLAPTLTLTLTVSPNQGVTRLRLAA